MDFLNSFFHFVTDNTKRLSSKAALILSVIIVLICLDNLFGFSFYYNTDKKLSELKEINIILKDSSITPNVKQKILSLRQDVIYHASWKDRVWNFFSKNKTNIPLDEKKDNQYSKRNFWLHFFTASWFFILCMVAIPFAGFSDKSSPFGKTLIIALVAEPVFLGLAWLESELLYLVPVVFNMPLINYLLNFFLNCLIIWLVHLGINRKKF